MSDRDDTPPAASVPIRAIFWDFGGVILTSPFDAFNDYEREHDLPENFLRSVNAINPDSNAWARIERREITPDEFDSEFAAESEALGHRVPGRDVLALIHGTIRPEMVTALDRTKQAGYIVACLTNNISSDARPDVTDVMNRFDFVVESSKVGCRKPEPDFYVQACKLVGVAPDEVVFLDDLGINLKPAAAMGMTTIKVTGSAQARADLGAVIGLDLT